MYFIRLLTLFFFGIETVLKLYVQSILNLITTKKIPDLIL